MTPLKKIPFFLFLLALFFCVHGWQENYGFIRASEILKPGLLIVSALILATAIFSLFTRNLVFASLVVLFTGAWYLFFGAIHDFVKSLPFLSFIHSYSAMIVLLLLATVGWILFLGWKRGLQPRLVLFFNMLLVIYCSIDIVLLIRKSHVNNSKKGVTEVHVDPGKIKAKPSLYLLLFDGYPGFKSLQDSFGFDNKDLLNYFNSRSFNVLPVFSNYDYTYFSMSSLFNMQYVYDDFDDLKLTARDFQKRGVEINRNRVVSVFKSMGYAVENLSIFEFDDKPPVSVANSFLLAHAILLTDKILHNRLKRDVGDRLMKVIPFWKNNDFYQHDIDNKRAEELLNGSAREKSSTPKFVYAHFMMPHGPYYYDSLGNKNPYGQISHYTQWKNKGLFVSYLKYINKKLRAMCDNIIEHDPGAIIIVMGDHGFRSYGFNQLYQPLRFDNLCAVRFPGNGNDFPMKQESRSTVNLFRYLFNNRFGQDIPYLADSSVVLSY